VSQTRSTSIHTLGAALERDRLEHRVSRVAAAISVLRHLESDPRREPPRHIRQTIADFEAQSAAMKARLGELAGHAARSSSPGAGQAESLAGLGLALGGNSGTPTRPVWHTHMDALDGW
jgi:hypothetical protein